MVIYLLVVYLIYDVVAIINVLDKGVVPLEKNSVGIKFFINIANEDRIQNCKVHWWAKRCCLNDTEKTDCSVMKLFSRSTYNVKPKCRETIISVYPTIIQHDLVGYCDFLLISKCGRSIRNDRRFVYIPFDTRTSIWLKSHLFKSYINDEKRAECDSLDEDSLNECKPVFCDHKYAGARSFYAPRKKKCIPAPTCISVASKEMPDLVYVPISNICRDLEYPLSVKDVYDINTGSYVTTEPPDVAFELRSNCSTLSENLKLLMDVMLGKVCINDSLDKVDYSRCVTIAVLRMLGWIAFTTLLLLCCVLIMWFFSTDGRQSEAGSYTVGSHWQSLMDCWSKKKMKSPLSYFSLSQSSLTTNAKVKNDLLKEVMVRDIPMELRESVVNICGRMDTEVKWKQRYRRGDLGSQISLRKAEYSETNTSSDTEEDEYTEKDKLLK